MQVKCHGVPVLRGGHFRSIPTEVCKKTLPNTPLVADANHWLEGWGEVGLTTRKAPESYGHRAHVLGRWIAEAHG